MYPLRRQLILSTFMATISCTHSKPSALSPKKINWLPYPTPQTIKEAWMTWDQFYRKKTKPRLFQTLFEFSQTLEKKSSCVMTSIADVDPTMENSRLNRYKLAKSAKEAYPAEDRPRGQKDLDSVNYHLMTHQAISPIIVLSLTDINGNKRVIKLDGMHRLMAALIKQSAIRICYLHLANN